MSCCKKVFILCDPMPSCIMQLLILTPVISGNVNIKVVDKFNRVYYAEKTTDGTGLVTLQIVQDNTIPDSPILADFPASLFNEYAGNFIVQVYDMIGNEKQWTISGLPYDALQLRAATILPVVASYTINPTYAEGDSADFNNDFSADFTL